MAESLNQQIADLITQHAVDLERFKVGERRAVLRLLAALEQALIAAVATHDVTAPPQVAYQQARQAALLKQSQTTIQTAYRGIASQHRETLAGLAALEEGFARAVINQPISSMIPSESPPPPPSPPPPSPGAPSRPQPAIQVELASTALSPEQLKAIASDVSIEGAHVDEWWRRQEESLRFNFQRQVQLGMMQGEGVDKMVERVRGTRANNFRDGIMDAPKHQAEALVRTSVQNVAARARRESFEANADVIKAIQQISTLDARTTQICMAYSGKQWSLPDYQPIGHDLPYEGGVPRHWNCRSSEIPVTRSWQEMGAEGIDTGGRPAHDPDAYFRKRFREKLEERHADEIRKGSKRQGIPIEEWIDRQVGRATRNAQSSMDGYVPADMDYEAWLRTKPVEFQKNVLGKGKWDLWDQGKLTFSELVDESGRPLSLAQLAERTADIQPPPVTKEMFDRLSEKGLTATVTDDVIEAWNQGIGRAPDRVFGRLFEGIENVQSVDIEGGMIGKDAGVIRFSAKGSARGVQSIQIERSLMFTPREGLVANHSFFNINPDLQRRGIGKQFMKNSFGLYEDLGVQKVKMRAGMEVGGYAWARYGFTPTKSDWNNAVKPLVRARMESVALTDGERKDLTKWLRSDDPHSIYKVADMGRETQVEGLTTGQRLLLGSEYNAEIDLSDRKAMRRFNQYVGR
jgi:SPP1 gp7 family putative phage head morphogenesis protein